MECEHCGATFSGRKRKYCTQRCQNAARDRRRRRQRPARWSAEDRATSKERHRLTSRHGEAVSRGRYAGTLEEYAYYIERVRMGCGRADGWKKWMPKKALPPRKPGKYSHLTDAEYYRIKYSTRPSFRLKERMRRQFMKWLNGGRTSVPSFLGAVSYTIEQLRQHIERQFVKGMRWENFGDWHIDHIRPKGLFDPQDDQDVQECWALTNLRPAWRADNLARPRDGRDLLL